MNSFKFLVSVSILLHYVCSEIISFKEQNDAEYYSNNANDDKENNKMIMDGEDSNSLFGDVEQCLSTSISINASMDTCNQQQGQTAMEKRDKIIGENEDQQQSVPVGCKLVMAPSTLPNSGWGIFTLVEIPQGYPVLSGDIVIQVPDINSTHVDSTFLLLHDYLWNSEETGGYYEGEKVLSVIPGIGMLANGLPARLHNVLPYVPTVDEGGLTRTDSPGAGAITHYHNYTFYASRRILAAHELFVNYGPKWFHERRNRTITTASTETTSTTSVTIEGGIVENTSEALFQHNVTWLRQQGRCLDNMKPGKSKQSHAGRGVFATRFLPIGSIVAPVPVIVIGQEKIMDMTRRINKKSAIVQTKQLLLNYCYGHTNSSLLFFSYSPMINLVNHGRGKYANVKLQWSKSNVLHPTGIQWLNDDNLTIDVLRRKKVSGLLLELVAIQPIRTGDEILLDYGDEWIESWIRHVSTWKPPPKAESYAPAYVQDDVIQALRTETELKQHPYPDNIFTSCFYRYSDNKDLIENPVTNKSKSDAISTSATTTTTFRWNMTRGLFELKNLRPCNVLQRRNPLPTQKMKGTTFTVQIRNRFGLNENEQIPKGHIHIVTDVPRHAIRLTDKVYSTDQHLENAFRNKIYLPDDLYFPKQWQDL